MNQKLLIVLVVLLVVLFLCGTGAGILNGPSSGKPISLTQPGIDALGSLLQPHLGMGDVSLSQFPTPSPGACDLTQPTGGFTVSGSATCTFVIKSSSAEVRKIVLHLAGNGASANVSLSQTEPQSGLTQVPTAIGAVPFGSTETVMDKLAVFKNGGILTVQCLSGTPCIFTLR